VDVLQSSRQVRVALHGVKLALTTRPRLLFGTGLRVRTNVPLPDVRVELLRPSDTTTECPYTVYPTLPPPRRTLTSGRQGVANYYHVQLPNGDMHKDIVWFYRVPQPECGHIMGYLTIYDEAVDIWVDGEKQG